jgi:HlyD family secretion protein
MKLPKFIRACRVLARFLRRKSHHYFAHVAGQIRRVEEAPATGRALVLMDNSIHFLTMQQQAESNSAVAAVRKPLLFGSWFILALLGVTLIWGVLAPIESAAIAHGSVVLLSNKKTIQHLEGGIIRDIAVKEGDTVVAGQTLIRLDDTAAAASRDSLQGQLYTALATEARLAAERDGLAEIAFSKEMLERSQHDVALAKALAAQRSLHESTQGAQKAKLTMFRQRIAQSVEQIEGLKAQREGAAGQLELLAEEIETVKGLLAKGFATRTRLLELQRRQSELQGSRGEFEAKVGEANQHIHETEMAIVNEQGEFASKRSQDLRDIQAEIGELQEKLRAASDVVKRTVIAAPTGGIVTGLKQHTLGGVISPGAPIMEIIPQDDQLVIEAKVNPTDIDTVHAGLDARVMFTAYKMRSTPKVPGKITQISADSFSDERNPQASPYYVARIEVDKEFLETMNQHVRLYPGMPAEVMIRTGSRSFLGYLFHPITDSMHRAFREE